MTSACWTATTGAPGAEETTAPTTVGPPAFELEPADNGDGGSPVELATPWESALRRGLLQTGAAGWGPAPCIGSRPLTIAVKPLIIDWGAPVRRLARNITDST